MLKVTGIVSRQRFYERRKLSAVLISGLLFLLVCLLAAKFQFYLIWLLPPALIIILLAIVRIDLFFLLLLFLTPLSLQLRFLVNDPPVDIFLPTEIMLFMLLIIMAYKYFNKREFNWALVGHPVSIIIISMLIWMFITSLSGTMILVSFKYFLARLWFVTTFYFLAAELFSRRDFARRSLVAFLAGLLPVIVYHLAGLSRAGMFNQQAAHITMWPFFNDHTSFGATLAFMIPVLFWLVLGKEGINTSLPARTIYALILLLFIGGLVFSYSRAAWISLVVSLLLVFVLLLRVPLKLVITAGVIIVVTIVLSWNSIITNMSQNQETASANMFEHVRSVTNITTDDSNRERINRWKSALRMIAEKPLTGWGPGTYQFRYAPYQFSHERTSISTNFGDRGNAHSEYLGSAVDSGIPGGLLFILLAISSIASGYRVWRLSTDNYTRYLTIALIAGLVSYLFHGMLNNFLDTDKISAPFWIFIALIVRMDIELSKQLKSEESG